MQRTFSLWVIPELFDFPLVSGFPGPRLFIQAMKHCIFTVNSNKGLKPGEQQLKQFEEIENQN